MQLFAANCFSLKEIAIQGATDSSKYYSLDRVCFSLILFKCRQAQSAVSLSSSHYRVPLAYYNRLQRYYRVIEFI